MRKTQETLRIKDSIKEAVLYIAFELSKTVNGSWLLVMEVRSGIK